MLHAAFLRSMSPHATLGAIDASEALALPRVVAVFTGEDMQRMTNPMMEHDRDGELLRPVVLVFRLWTGCATGRSGGDRDRRCRARWPRRTLCERIVVDYELAGRHRDPSTRWTPTANCRGRWTGATSSTTTPRDHGDVDAAFAGATRKIVKATFDTGTGIANQPMETAAWWRFGGPGRVEVTVDGKHGAAQSLLWLHCQGGANQGAHML